MKPYTRKGRGKSREPLNFGGHQPYLWTIDICVQHSGREAPRCADLSAAAETCGGLVLS